MAAHPLTIALSQLVGSGVVSEILGQFMPEPGRAAVGERLRATRQFLPELEAAARGRPSASTEAQIARLGEEVTRYKQIAGASARKSGIAGTTTAAAALDRLEVGRQRGVADILGRGQREAAAQLIGLGPQAITMQREIEQQRQLSLESLLGDVGSIFADAQLEEERGVMDASYKEMLDMLREALMGLIPGGARPALAAGQRRVLD